MWLCVCEHKNTLNNNAHCILRPKHINVVVVEFKLYLSFGNLSVNIMCLTVLFVQLEHLCCENVERSTIEIHWNAAWANLFHQISVLFEPERLCMCLNCCVRNFIQLNNFKIEMNVWPDAQRGSGRWAMENSTEPNSLLTNSIFQCFALLLGDFIICEFDTVPNSFPSDSNFQICTDKIRLGELQWLADIVCYLLHSRKMPWFE